MAITVGLGGVADMDWTLSLGGLFGALLRCASGGDVNALMSIVMRDRDDHDGADYYMRRLRPWPYFGHISTTTAAATEHVV